jgi:UDP-N-acetylmuramyl pentapeptide phosphotransferase/UDP-N-acetylglucosamine-1-phosphate transferase
VTRPDVLLATHISAFITGLVLSLVATPVVRALAIRWDICAVPAEDRWHRRPVPLLGGIAIAIGLAGGCSFTPRTRGSCRWRSIPG